MAQKAPATRVKKHTANTDGNQLDGREVNNKILLSLPKNESSEVFAKLDFVTLPIHSVLNEVGERIKYAYFINDGLASVLSIMGDGKSVEVGLCGREGFIGIPLAAGFSSSPTRVIMQVAGSAYRLSAAELIESLRNCATLTTGIGRFSQELTLQSTHVAACNRLHDIDERLARWLLMSQDRLGGDTVNLTQEFLAHMLGTRRASVTVAAGILQKAGIISYSRGSVKIVSRDQLEDATCECYQAINQQTQKWRNETS